jgi:hypothetical protein
MSGPVVSKQQSDLVNLEADERILGNVEYSWLDWLGWLLAGLILIPVFGIGLVLLFLVYRSKSKSGCVITNQRVVRSKAGLLSTKTTEVRMSDIRSLTTYNSWRSGGVSIDNGATELSVPVSNPQEMVNVIREQQNKMEAQ